MGLELNIRVKHIALSIGRVLPTHQRVETGAIAPNGVVRLLPKCAVDSWAEVLHPDVQSQAIAMNNDNPVLLLSDHNISHKTGITPSFYLDRQ
ncbi:hypothetical protein CI593_07530 [Fischerella thermalis CCMEE 5194]|nr:hypothetical protein CI593_07530 [Fischerella thermalis CCMEE 5194]